ncbi:MAG: hypothetical protein ABI528_01900 [bacterium]
MVYAVGFFRTIVKTTDGGEHWIKIQSGMQGDGNYECVFFINENTGWIGNFDSPEFGVRKTTDGGKTIFSNAFLGFPHDIYFKDSLEIYIQLKVYTPASSTLFFLKTNLYTR